MQAGDGSRPTSSMGGGEAHLVKLACSQASGERSGWTLNLLAEQLVELAMVESISHETVRCVLKKRSPDVAEAEMVHCAGT